VEVGTAQPRHYSRSAGCLAAGVGAVAIRKAKPTLAVLLRRGTRPGRCQSDLLVSNPGGFSCCQRQLAPAAVLPWVIVYLPGVMPVPATGAYHSSPGLVLYCLGSRCTSLQVSCLYVHWCPAVPAWCSAVLSWVIVYLPGVMLYLPGALLYLPGYSVVWSWVTVYLPGVMLYLPWFSAVYSLVTACLPGIMLYLPGIMLYLVANVCDRVCLWIIGPTPEMWFKSRVLSMLFFLLLG
jgi:hypothetical protein